jgi:hypothetical protein
MISPVQLLLAVLKVVDEEGGIDGRLSVLVGGGVNLSSCIPI